MNLKRIESCEKFSETKGSHFFKKKGKKDSEGVRKTSVLEPQTQTGNLCFTTLLALLEKSYKVAFREVTGMRFQIMIPN